MSIQRKALSNSHPIGGCDIDMKQLWRGPAEGSCSRDSGVSQCNALRDNLRDTGRVNNIEYNIIPPQASAAPAQHLNFPTDSEYSAELDEKMLFISSFNILIDNLEISLTT